MDIKQAKTIIIRILEESKIILLEYILTKKVLWLALASLPFSLYFITTAVPNFYVSAVVLAIDEEPQTTSKMETLASVFTSGAKEGAQKNAKFISSAKSSDTALALWDKWALRLFNGDPKNKDVDKISQRHTVLQRTSAWLGGYDLPKYLTFLDLQNYIRSGIVFTIDFQAYEIEIGMFSRDVDFTKEFLNDVIMVADSVAKKQQINKSKVLIKTLKRDLQNAKNSSIVGIFSEKINNEYYKIATLDNEMPYYITYLDKPRSSPYPVSPNILAIIFSNLILFIFIGVGINFWNKNKDDIW
jgi:hypothetical protein